MLNISEFGGEISQYQCWDAEPGEHRSRCRARDADGDVQTEEVAPVAPNGATGWHEIDVSVS